jgi:hypothetical protein
MYINVMLPESVDTSAFVVTVQIFIGCKIFYIYCNMSRHIQLNLVDEDSRELVSAWLLTVAATSPAVMRSYDVDVPAGRPLHKKIVFKNPWDVPRVFRLSSSDEALMRPREVSRLGGPALIPTVVVKIWRRCALTRFINSLLSCTFTWPI